MQARAVARFSIRRIAVQIKGILHEGGPVPARTQLVGAIFAVVENPFSARFEPDIATAMQDLKPLGLIRTDRVVAALARIGGDGKAAMVGKVAVAEHGALWRVPGGCAVRARLRDARAIGQNMTEAAKIWMLHLRVLVAVMAARYLLPPHYANQLARVLMLAIFAMGNTIADGDMVTLPKITSIGTLVLVVGMALVGLMLFAPRGMLGKVRAKWLKWLP